LKTLSDDVHPGTLGVKNLHAQPCKTYITAFETKWRQTAQNGLNMDFVEEISARKGEIYRILRGMLVAVYIAGQERRLVDPPSQWLLG
jgi:hypothetical protein